MKAGEIRDLGTVELAERLTQLRRERFNLRFQKATGQLEKTGRVREVRRDIARMMTVLAERERAGSASGS